jgi:hypothetical protein
MTKGENLSEFELYLEEVQRRARRSLSEIEKLGTDAALGRCRELARQVQSQLNRP